LAPWAEPSPDRARDHIDEPRIITMKLKPLAVSAGLFLCAVFPGAALAQMPPMDQITMTSIAPPPEDALGIPLYAGVAPGSEGATQKEQWNLIFGQKGVRNVTRPTLTPYLPTPGKATGAAVIVAPGGAYMMLAMDNEGRLVAQWLADHGVAAFVLKYRLDATPADNNAALAAIGARVGAAAKSGADHAPPIHQPLAIDDAQVALQLVRSRAGEWGVDPHRVGMIGFSAGAMTTLQTALESGAGPRPDFVGIIYGPMNGVTPPPNPPPMFVAIANDDPLFGDTDYGLAQAWRKARAPFEMHVYERGDHGFGMTRKGSTSDLWIDQFFAWIKARGLLVKG
jgi:acetyl esterase/lipase